MTIGLTVALLVHAVGYRLRIVALSFFLCEMPSKKFYFERLSCPLWLWSNILWMWVAVFVLLVNYVSSKFPISLLVSTVVKEQVDASLERLMLILFLFCVKLWNGVVVVIRFSQMFLFDMFERSHLLLEKCRFS